MEKLFIVYKDMKPVMKFYVSPENTLSEIENSFPGYKVTLYDGNKRVLSYDYDKITKGKILLSPQETTRKNILTGNKDVDLIILSELKDRDLFNFCLSNQEASQLCRDENFWRNRFYQKYGSLLEEAPELKPKDMSWKNFYMSVIIQLDSFQKNDWTWMNIIDWDINTDVFKGLSGSSSDPDKNVKYWLLDLGKEVVIQFPLDRYEELEPEDNLISAKTYGEPYLTPRLILNAIYQFYQQPITLNELELQQENDNPYAEDYTEEQVKAGKVIRKDMLGEPFYEGLVYQGEMAGVPKYSLSLGT